MPHSIEKRTILLKTLNCDSINTNKTIITWNNINLRVLLGTLYDKYKKFNIVLKSITSFSTALTSIATDRQTKICLTGLNFLHNYDIEYKCNFNKAIFTGRYFYNTSDNLISDGHFEDLILANNATLLISTMTNEQLYTFNWIGNNTTLLNGNSTYGYSRPYPSNLAQVVAFDAGANGSYISTNLYLNSGQYTLTFYTARRPTFTATINLDVYIDDTIIYSVLPGTNNWTLNTTNFFTDNDKTYTLKFYASGINATDINYAIDNVILNRTNNFTTYLENAFVKTFSTDGSEKVDLTIEMQDLITSNTSNGVLPNQVFTFDFYGVD
jgi:hypothetical protein